MNNYLASFGPNEPQIEPEMPEQTREWEILAHWNEVAQALANQREARRQEYPPPCDFDG